MSSEVAQIEEIQRSVLELNRRLEELKRNCIERQIKKEKKKANKASTTSQGIRRKIHD